MSTIAKKHAQFGRRQAIGKADHARKRPGFAASLSNDNSRLQVEGTARCVRLELSGSTWATRRRSAVARGQRQRDGPESSARLRGYSLREKHLAQACLMSSCASAPIIVAVLRRDSTCAPAVAAASGVGTLDDPAGGPRRPRNSPALKSTRVLVRHCRVGALDVDRLADPQSAAHSGTICAMRWRISCRTDRSAFVAADIQIGTRVADLFQHRPERIGPALTAAATRERTRCGEIRPTEMSDRRTSVGGVGWRPVAGVEENALSRVVETTTTMGPSGHKGAARPGRLETVTGRGAETWRVNRGESAVRGGSRRHATHGRRHRGSAGECRG